MTPKKYWMETISKDVYDILTQVTFKVKTCYYGFFLFKNKSKNTQRVWDENIGYWNFFCRKCFETFFIYIDFVVAKLFLITAGSTRCKKLMYRFRFYFVCFDRFTMTFRIMWRHDASIILIEINVYLFRTGHSISLYSSL